MIEDLAKQSELPLVYIDTDTFVYQPTDSFLKDLNAKKVYMHLDEGSLKGMKYTPLKMWHQIKEKSFGGITIKESMHMWNAGLVAIPVDKRLACLELALAICDDMCAAGVTPRLIEQYALSVALDRIYELKPADSFVGHYWGNKPEWDDYIKTFLADQHLKGNSIEQSVKDINDADLYKIPIFKHVSSKKPALDKLLNKLLVKNKMWIKNIEKML